MTFEDYIKGAEKFGSIDTPEKIAFYKHQYQSHLLAVEDDNYFEPFENFSGSDFISQYEKNLNALFKFDQIGEGQFYFLIRPSFEPENLLIVEKSQEKYILTHTILEESYWYAYSADNTITDVSKTTLTAVLSNAIGNKLFALLDKIINEARKPLGKSFILDGVVYILSYIVDSQQKIVTQHSPGEDSKSGKVIALLEQLISNIKNLSETTLLSIEAQIDNLQG